jgi:hypothetical protein
LPRFAKIHFRLLEQIGYSEETAQERSLKAVGKTVGWPLGGVANHESSEVHQLLIEHSDGAGSDSTDEAVMKVWIEAREPTDKAQLMLSSRRVWGHIERRAQATDHFDAVERRDAREDSGDLLMRDGSIVVEHLRADVDHGVPKLWGDGSHWGEPRPGLDHPRNGRELEAHGYAKTEPQR